MRTPDRLLAEESSDTVYDADVSLDKGYWEFEARALSRPVSDIWLSDIDYMLKSACPQFHAVSVLDRTDEAATEDQTEFCVGVRWGTRATSSDSLQARRHTT